MKTTRTWRVYGTFKNFAEINYDFSEENNTRIIKAKLVSDYIKVTITRNTAEECERELDGQLSDGLFENIRYTKVEEVDTTTITIKNNRGETVLETTSATYKEDLNNNRDKFNLWHRCFVEYKNGSLGFDSPLPNARKVIVHNGKTIYADWNISIGGVQNVCDELIELFDEDFGKE